MFEVEKKYKSASVSRTIRFTEDLFEQLNKVADENEISFNLLVLQCCRYALDNMAPPTAISIDPCPLAAILRLFQSAAGANARCSHFAHIPHFAAHGTITSRGAERKSPQNQ